jgi:Zn-finger nucleic acid-binding protein
MSANPSGPSNPSLLGLVCPSCRVALVMSERQGIEIDYCPQCRGVWLDRGELDKIIERSARETAPAAELQRAPQAAPRRDYGDDDREPSHGYGQTYRKRRKSFLEDLFD